MIEQPATPLANLYAIFSTGPLLLMGLKRVVALRAYTALQATA